ncbi:hypothetical protein ACIPKK_07870 [Enterobacter asburiae]|uniref:hypothetical protein n=1 Tax=Enterobacter asburiae TaxID=61645 RepID=UPI00381C2040
MQTFSFQQNNSAPSERLKFQYQHSLAESQTVDHRAICSAVRAWAAAESRIAVALAIKEAAEEAGIEGIDMTGNPYNQSFTLTAYVFAIFPQTLPAWGFAIWDATGKLVLTNESRVLSDLQTVGDAGANGGINIDQTLSGSWAVAPAQLGQTIITNNATKPPTIYTINAYSSCRFNGGSTRINAGGTSTGTGSPGGGTNTGTSLTAINTSAYD